MQKYFPALRIALGVFAVLFAAMIILGLVAGVDKPFAPVFPMLMSLIAIGTLSGSKLPTPDCPTCGTRQPAARTPTSFRQALLGGWTCANCGTEIDRNGHAIGKPAGK